MHHLMDKQTKSQDNSCHQSIKIFSYETTLINLFQLFTSMDSNLTSNDPNADFNVSRHYPLSYF